MNELNIVLTGGGTAGHINPALALAEELQSRGASVFFAGTPSGIESKLVPEAGIPFTPFEASGFNRRHPKTLPLALKTIHKSEKLARAWLCEINASVVVGFGGYVSLPVARAAESLKIPVVVHEQNSHMGMANKQLSRRAAATCLTYMCAAQGTHANNPILTGNPVRASLFSTTRDGGRAAFNVPDAATLLIVFGGSLGARHINQAICAMKDAMFAQANLYVIHVTGPKEFDAVEEALALTDAQRKRYQIFGYLNNMPEALNAADAVVSRAGATTLAEISALRVPALLVPYPFATADHQTTNAREYVEAGCAYWVPDAQVEGEQFKEYVLKLVQDSSVREKMRKAASAFKTTDAAKVLADVVIKAAHT